LNGKEDLVAALKAVAPNGINMYYENVGGIHFAAAMDVLAPRGRVAVCG
jgi:NADPH-dependent curcumin reductase CurA